MKSLELKVFPDPVLKRKATPVDVFDKELEELVASMRLVMQGHDGVGLAAPQVGISKRIAVIERDDTFYVLINPEIIETEGEQTGEEGCLSFPGVFAEVKRPMRVKIRALDTGGKEQILEAEGFLARAFLHEMDHLDGTLFIDYLSALKKNLIRKKMQKRTKNGDAE